MSLGDRLRRVGKGLAGPHADGVAEVHIGDPSYDDWPVVRDFEEIGTARAWRQQVTELGIEAVLTSDWPPDEHGRGDISLRVPQGSYADASNVLEPEL